MSPPGAPASGKHGSVSGSPRGRVTPPPVGESPAMREVLAAAEDVAVASITVLILGDPTGSRVRSATLARPSQTSSSWRAA